MNLPDLIKTGESPTVEFKEKFDERCIESAVAFANTKGGVIFIGVSDKNNIKGIKIGKETINQWVNQISQSTEPRLIPGIEKIQIDGKTVIAVQIKEYPIKPVSTKGRCFKRVDSSNRTMTTQEITQMYLHSTGLSWDKYPAQNASLEDIDFEKVKRYIKKAKETGRKRIGDIHKNINVEFVMTGKPERDQIWDYPLEALREALINAVCHRDYTILSHIEIRIYDDKLVIWSPGRLPFGITLDELYKPHSSALRNKGLAEVFYDTELIEQWGSGIEKMQKYCLNAGLPEPIFEEYQGFQVVFRKDIYNEDYLRSLNLNERQIKAVLYVKKIGNITNKEYQEVCNTSERTASRDLAELVSKGLFEQIGITGKGTAYILRRQRRHNDAI